jgi:hypothetical protein
MSDAPEYLWAYFEIDTSTQRCSVHAQDRPFGSTQHPPKRYIRADIAEARIAELEAALRDIGGMAHSDTCSTELTFMGHACDCHVGRARDALKETPDD